MSYYGPSGYDYDLYARYDRRGDDYDRRDRYDYRDRGPDEYRSTFRFGEAGGFRPHRGGDPDDDFFRGRGEPELAFRGGDRKGGKFNRGKGKKVGGAQKSVPPPPKKPKIVDNWESCHPMMQYYFMNEIPENFEQDWLFMVCPLGKRRFIVAAQDVTQSYNDAGTSGMKFMSCLPSGSSLLNEVYKLDDITILDTIYHNESKAFYIKDMLHWKHYPFYDVEADVRHFMLADKHGQLKKPDEVSVFNEHPIRLLPMHPCSTSCIEEALKAAEFKVHGLLFMRKSGLYVSGDSSDCLWLKLDKMESVLGVTIPEGVEFFATNKQDEITVAELDGRIKLRASRDAARNRIEADDAEVVEADSLKDKEVDNSGDNQAEPVAAEGTASEESYIGQSESVTVERDIEGTYPDHWDDEAAFDTDQESAYRQYQF